MNKLAVAVLSGVAVGFAIGILVAPEKGAELRKKISDAAGNWAEKLIDVLAASANRLTDSATDISVNPDKILE